MFDTRRRHTDARICVQMVMHLPTRVPRRHPVIRPFRNTVDPGGGHMQMG